MDQDRIAIVIEPTPGTEEIADADLQRLANVIKRPADRIKARIARGQSITLVPGQYHKFWGEAGTGTVLLGEVSTVGDDRVDNRFYEATGRLPEIVEDKKPKHLLFKDYPALEKLLSLSD